MRLSKMVGERTKENPADVIVKSHALMVRGGYMKQVANGIYTLLPPAKRVSRKIENIIREEMDKLDGQEVLFPVVMPRELWEESGRYSSIGGEMVRFTDRSNKGLVLGMTHEEAAVHLCRNTVSSYQQMPFMIYQIQTKFRDEKRARAGLIRVREFTMKDAYSFHMTQEDLEEYYNKVHEAYVRIFNRIGMKNFISVKSDSGMMGGSVSHEFMLLTEIGEDTIAICDECEYKANMEVADGKLPEFDFGEDRAMEEVFTDDAKTIEEVCERLNLKQANSIKAVSFAVKGDEKQSCLVFIRGDLEVNESKVKKILGTDIVPNDLADSNLVQGNIGPISLVPDENTTVIFDESLENAYNLCGGANKKDYHIVGINIKRDCKVEKFENVAKVIDGAVCPICGKGHIHLKNGIEIGNIFQLGTKYTDIMGMRVLDNNGKATTPIMGCYGIGVGRALASVVEESSTEKGIIWPMSIAPWQVELCPLRYEKAEIKPVADKLFEDMKSEGIEVLLDDRKASPGFKFADSELLGCPLRIVISPRSLKTNEAEIKSTDGKVNEMIAINKVIDFAKNYIAEEIAKCNK